MTQHCILQGPMPHETSPPSLAPATKPPSEWTAEFCFSIVMFLGDTGSKMAQQAIEELRKRAGENDWDAKGRLYELGLHDKLDADEENE